MDVVLLKLDHTTVSGNTHC